MFLRSTTHVAKYATHEFKSATCGHHTDQKKSRAWQRQAGEGEKEEREKHL